MSNEITTAIPESLMRFAAAKEQIALLATQCSNFIVNSPDSLSSAKELAKDARKIENLIEDKRKELTKPLLDEQRNIKAFADNLTSELNVAVNNLRQQIKDYELELERIRKEEQRRLEEERRKQEEEIRRQAEELKKKVDESGVVDDSELKILQDEILQLKEIETQQKEAQSSAPTSIRKTWTFEVTDAMQIPRSYLMPDEKAIKLAIAEGIREISGVRIYQKEDLYLR